MVVCNKNDSTSYISYMVKKYIKTIINMALNLEEALEFTCENGHWKDCSL